MRPACHAPEEIRGSRPGPRIRPYRRNSDIDLWGRRDGQALGGHDADVVLPTVAELLEILPEGWTVIPGLHDLVPELAEADQVVVGPGGVFVVVAPEWVGPFGVEDGVVVANGVTREQETEACLDTAVAVADLSPAPTREWIVPVLCVTERGAALEWAMEARVCSLAKPRRRRSSERTGRCRPPSHVKHARHTSCRPPGCRSPSPVVTPRGRGPEPIAARPEPRCRSPWPEQPEPAPEPLRRRTDRRAGAEPTPSPRAAPGGRPRRPPPRSSPRRRWPPTRGARECTPAKAEQQGPRRRSQASADQVAWSPCSSPPRWSGCWASTRPHHPGRARCPRPAQRCADLCAGRERVGRPDADADQADPGPQDRQARQAAQQGGPGQGPQAGRDPCQAAGRQAGLRTGSRAATC